MIKEAVVTPEEVVEAYRKTGLIPVEGLTYEIIEGEAHGCAIGALYMKEHGEPSSSTPQRECYCYAETLFPDTSFLFGVGFDVGLKEKSEPDFKETLDRDFEQEDKDVYYLGYDCGVRVKEELCSS